MRCHKIISALAFSPKGAARAIRSYCKERAYVRSLPWEDVGRVNEAIGTIDKPLNFKRLIYFTTSLRPFATFYFWF